MVTIWVIIICRTLLRIQRDKNRFIESQRNYYLSNTNLDKSFTSIIDDIISDVETQYELLNFAALDQQGNLYITEEMQNKMIEEVFTTVYTSISPIAMDKFLLVYSREYLEDMIAKKVQLTVLNYCISVNGSYQDKK